MRKKHHNVFGEHIYYVRNEIQKPFKMGTLQYTEHVHGMFKMDKLTPPPRRNNEEYHEAAWDTRDMPYKQEMICKAIKDVLLDSINEQVKEKFSSNYRTIPTEECIGILGTLQAMYDRRSAYSGYQNPIYKKKTADQPDGDFCKIETIPRVNHKKHTPNPGKGKQQKNSIHCSTQRYFLL